MLLRTAAVVVCCGTALAAGISLSQELMAEGFIGAFRAFAVGQKSALAYVNGRTLYTFAKDEPGKSNCTGACAEAWPPALVGPGDRDFTDFTIITRADGGKQWAYKGKPLYLSVRDTANGQCNGNGVDEQWYIVEVPAHEM